MAFSTKFYGCENLVAEHLRKPPPLGLRNWPHLLDTNTISYGSFSLLIVSVELFRSFDDFFELRMRNPGNELDHDRLVHPGGDYVAYPLLS